MNYYVFCCYDVLLLSCFLTGCLLMRKSWLFEYKLLVVLSGLTLVVEVAVQLSFFLKTSPLPWLYNYFIPLEAGCIVYILYRTSVHRALKRLQSGLLICLPIGIGVSCGLHPVFLKLNESIGLFCLFVELMSSCFFLIDALLDNSNTPLTRRPLFWLTCGLIFYCSNFILMHALMSYLPLTKISPKYYVLNGIIANVFMYAGFIGCFISLRPAKIRQEPGRRLA